MARLLHLGVVGGQHELDSAVSLPAPADPGESAAEAGKEEEALGQDDHTGQKQGECECGWKVELVVAFLKGPRPAVGERVQRAQHQGNEAQRRLWEEKARMREKGHECQGAAVFESQPPTFSFKFFFSFLFGRFGFFLSPYKSQG